MILICKEPKIVDGYYTITEKDVQIVLNNYMLVQMHPKKIVVEADVNKEKIKAVLDAMRLKCEVEELV